MTHRRIVIRRYARPCVPFPLTPALSPGERENRFQSARTIDALGLAVRRDAGLPLSKGEGRGEGKGGVRACVWFLLFLLLLNCPRLVAQEKNTPAKAEPAVASPKDTNSPVADEPNSTVPPETNAAAEEETNASAQLETNAPVQQATNGLAPLEKASPGKPQPDSPARLDYSSFKIISDRNIFNPNRSPRMARNGRSNGSPPKAVKIESFALVGTMSSDKGRFAFFDSPSALYKKVLRQDGTIAGYTVKEITTQLVKLEAGGNVTELRVGMQMRRQDEGEWQQVAHSGTYATVKPSTAAATDTAGGEANSSAGEDEVLKKLMQKREQEK